MNTCVNESHLSALENAVLQMFCEKSSHLIFIIGTKHITHVVWLKNTFFTFLILIVGQTPASHKKQEFLCLY